MRKNARGVTALDLLITLTIATLLVSVGVPAFRSYGLNQRMNAAMTQLQSDLQFARGEAIRLGAHTLVCPGTPVHDCSEERDWHDGWIVYADLDGDRARQAGEPLLKEAVAVRDLSITSPPARRLLRFFPNGSAPGSNISITFCDARGPSHAHQIRVSNSGRIRRVEAGPDAGMLC